jgi:hypothetical protein
MAKITWLGEDELHQREDGSGMGPSYCKIFGLRFDKGKAVAVKDPSIIQRAIRNCFFEVELTAAEQDQYDEEHMPEAADHAPEPETRPVRRPPGRPPKVKPDAIDSNAA